jgi:hypothetical protein
MGIPGKQQTDQQQHQAVRMQMSLQQNAQNQQQLHQAQQGQMLQAQQQSQQLQLQQQMAAAAAQNPQGMNMASFQRNFPGQQDTSSTLAAAMRNFIQQRQEQEQWAQQQTPQQQQQQIQASTQPQSQQPGQTSQAQLLKQQFQNANQGNQNMNAANIYGQQPQSQQSYAANLAVAAQRQGGLRNLNQPINPTVQNSQTQDTLQYPAQLTPAELQKLAEDLGNYRYYSNFLTKQGKGGEPPQYLTQLYDRAIIRLNSVRLSHPNLNEQLKPLMNAHMQKLEAQRASQAGGVASGAST